MRFRSVWNTAMSEAMNIAATDSARCMSATGRRVKSIATPKIEKKKRISR